MDWTRWLASRAFFLACLVGLALVSALVLDTPQGLSDEEVRSSYRLSLGPFLVLFRLHHAGHSLALWGLLVALVLHVGAVMVTNRSAGKTALRGATRVGSRARWTLVPAVVLVLASVAGLVWAGGRERTTPPPDFTRLRVRVADAPGGPMTQIVEEGAAYEVPHPEGMRVLLFGVASRGPYALERTHNRGLRVHLPGLADESRPSVLGVDARRPAAGPADDALFGPGAAPPWFGLACAALAAFATGVLTRRGPSLAPAEWRTVSWMTASFLALLTLDPLVGWGRGRTPLAAASREDVVWSAVVHGPGHVAPWLASIPANVVLPGPWWLASLAGATTLLLVAVVLAGRAERTFPSGATRAVAGAGAGFAVLTGVAWLAHALGGIPAAASGADLLRAFEQDVLPRIPTEIEVTRWEVSSPGPYFVPIVVGLHAAIVVFASADLLARTARGRTGRTGPRMTTTRVATWTILALAVVRSVAAALFEPAAGDLPFALLALLVAALAPIASRLHPDWPASGLVTPLAAGVMLLAMP